MTFSPLKSKPKHVKVALLLPPPYTETLLTVIFLYECPFVQLQSLHVFEPVKKKKRTIFVKNISICSSSTLKKSKIL